MSKQQNRASSASSSEMEEAGIKMTSTNLNEIASIECDAPHAGRQLVDHILPINIDILFGYLFNKSKFFTEFHKKRNTTDLNQGSWEDQPDGTKKRMLTFVVAISNAIAVGPKTSSVTETQIMRTCSKPGIFYSIDATTVNKNIPYADAFYVQVHYCMKKTVDDHTFLSVHVQVIFKKNVWGLVKGFIEKNAIVGCEEFYSALKVALDAEMMPKAKAKAKERKRKGIIKTYSSSRDRAIETNNPTKDTENTKTTQPSAKIIDCREEIPHHPSNVSSKILWGIITILVLLFAINLAYSYKLWSIEKIETPLIDLSKPPSSEEMFKILLTQEKQLKSWRSAVESAILLLKKTERELEKVYEFTSGKKDIELSPATISTASS